MKKALRLVFALALICTLVVPVFGYSTDVVYDAAVEPPHVVSFDPCNGGEVIKITLNQDGYIKELPTPQNTTARGVSWNSANEFIGWYIDSDTPFTTTTWVDRDMSVYARWKLAPVTNTPTTSSPSGSGGVTSPKTFDPGIAHYCVMAVMSAAGSTAMVLSGNKKRYAEYQIDVRF